MDSGDIRNEPVAPHVAALIFPQFLRIKLPGLDWLS